MGKIFKKCKKCGNVREVISRNTKTCNVKGCKGKVVFFK